MISCAAYETIKDIEPFERYAAGGYFLVRLGDRIYSSRYHVVHKLGYGTSSITWLARDGRSAKYVALSIAVSDLDHPFESVILKKLWDGKRLIRKQHAGIPMIPKMLGEFVAEGRPSAQEVLESGWMQKWAMPAFESTGGHTLSMHSQRKFYPISNAVIRLTTSVNASALANLIKQNDRQIPLLGEFWYWSLTLVNLYTPP